MAGRPRQRLRVLEAALGKILEAGQTPTEAFMAELELTRSTVAALPPPMGRMAKELRPKRPHAHLMPGLPRMPTREIAEMGGVVEALDRPDSKGKER